MIFQTPHHYEGVFLCHFKIKKLFNKDLLNSLIINIFSDSLTIENVYN